MSSAKPTKQEMRTQLQRLRARVSELEEAEARFRQTEEVLRKRTHDLGERVKELNCLYSMSKLLENPDASLDDILQATVNLIPPAWQYPSVTRGRIILEDRTVRTRKFKATAWRQASDINVHGKRVGSLEVYYLEEMPEMDEGPFLAEERSLINVIAERLGSIIERKRAEAALEEHQRMLQISEKNLKRFSRRILSIREEEKKRLSVNLHDEIGSMVVALNSYLSIAEREVKDRSLEGVQRSIRQIQEAVQRSVDSIKKIATDLRPPNLDILGLSSALKMYFGNISKQTRLAIQFKTNINDKAVSDNMAIVLYRVAQEAVNNIVRHAGATAAEVRLYKRADAIRFSVEDDGRGFDVKKVLNKTDGLRFGILGMKERVESLSGTFNIKSRPEKGTKISVSLPASEGTEP